MVPVDPILSAGGAARGQCDRGTPFQQFVSDVRTLIDERLAWWLDHRVEEARGRGPDVAAVADAIRQIALRGGKRMRAVLLAAAYRGCGGEGGLETLTAAGVALELLQVYLLAHDDWMDGDDRRRGGPSIPAMMSARFGRQTGASRGPAPALEGSVSRMRAQNLADAASVLAGDLAAAWALTSMLELTIAPARVALAVREFGRVEEDVVHGQVLDVCATAGDACAVEAGYALKTASYTVRGPIVMGAHLAGADDAQLAALIAFAEPLGVAFQLRDDVLGTFGNASVMGKPLGGDLRKGKRTSLIVEGMRDPRTEKLLAHVLGRADAGEKETSAALAALEASGACSRIEDRIATLAGESMRALDRVRLTLSGRSLLAQAVVALTERDR